MGRGRAAPNGAVRLAPNGYHYTKVSGKWRLTHHIVVEKKLGRPVSEGERVIFIDGNRANLSPDNIEVRLKAATSLHRRLAQLEARLDELNAEIAIVKSQISEQESTDSLTN